MDIIIAVNSKYIDICKCMIHSLLRTNKDERMTFHLLNSTLSDNEIENISSFIRQYHADIRLYHVDYDIFRNLNFGSYSIETFYRILAYKILPVDIHRALWLDSDIIVRKSLLHFYYQDFEHMSIVACPDGNRYSKYHFTNQLKHKLGLDSDYIYFNSGVILFNFDKIRSNVDGERIREIIEQYSDKWIFPDQDILNILYAGDVKYNDNSIYNFQTLQIGDTDITDVAILHYAGTRKPWDPMTACPIARYYWKEQILMRNYADVIKFCVSLPKAVGVRAYRRVVRKLEAVH